MIPAKDKAEALFGATGVAKVLLGLTGNVPDCATIELLSSTVDSMRAVCARCCCGYWRSGSADMGVDDPSRGGGVDDKLDGPVLAVVVVQDNSYLSSVSRGSADSDAAGGRKNGRDVRSAYPKTDVRF